MSNNIIDCLFLHIPIIKPVNRFQYFICINKIAMGLFSMSNELSKIGFTPQIINYGLEKTINWDFDIAKYVKNNNIKIISMSMHWLYQVNDTIKIAKKIKDANPYCYIILGGYTASSFTQDILERFPFIDCIIKGEGEKPIVEIVKRINDNNKDLSGIENLYYRYNNEILHSDKIWFANEEELNSYNFNGLHFLKNSTAYPYFPYYVQKDLKSHKIAEMDTKSTLFFCLGRGCPGNCTWCGGGFNAVKQITGRDKITLRNPSVVAKEIIEYKNKYNLDYFYFCYDPYPDKQDYILELFEILGREMPNKINIKFENFGLPTKDFIDSFKKNLGPRSQIIISPEFGNEELRNRHKAFSFTNQALINCLDYITQKEIRCFLYFTQTEFETKENRQETLIFIQNIKKRFNKTEIALQPITDYEPYAPWTINPEKYGLTKNEYSLDYYLNL